MAWDFDVETAVEPDGPGGWSARLSDRWNIGDNPNGGYAAAVVVRALVAEAGHQAPISMTTHYLRPALGGAPATVRTEVIRSGRRTSTVSGSLVQDGQERLRVIATFGDLDGAAGTAGSRHRDLVTIDPPDVPPPGECPGRATLEQGVEVPIASRVDVRIHPDLTGGAEVGRAEQIGWIRFADGRPADALALPLFADAFPPSLFGVLGRVGWVPTIELTVHVRARPEPGWIRARFVTEDLQDGRLIEDGWLWDEVGTLVARSRQLGLLLE
jgi:acyl-CoA thioesterase